MLTADRISRRRRAERRARVVARRRAWLLLAVTPLAGVGLFLLLRGGGGQPRPAAGPSPAVRKAAPAPVVARPRPKPLPHPIPGYLLIADRGNDRILLVDSRKRVVWQYPKPGRRLALPFYFVDDSFFGPDYREIITNQEEQHTIEIVSFPGGRVVWSYGHVGQRGWAPGYLNTPDDAYLLPNGLRSVADAYNCRVLFIDGEHRILRQIGTTRVCAHDPPRLLGAVNGATPLPGGGTLVSEITGSWIDDFGPTGALRWSLRAPVSYPSDPQPIGPGRILLADYTRPGRALIIDRRGRVLWSYGPASGPGELDHPSLAMPLAPGLIAVNDDYRDRVVVISIRTHRIVWQYGHTDVKGTAHGYLSTPDGMNLLPYRVARRIPAIRVVVDRSAR